jgi:hypothetical protein
MNIPFLNKFFKKEIKPLSLPDSILVKKLKTVATINDLFLYKDTIIYHHAKSYAIPLMLLDIQRGLYIFEKKDWSYDDLKNATVEKAKNQNASKDTLSYQNTQDIIHQKFNELTHKDGVPIFNYLLMENLNAQEYEHLDSSFHQLLPRDRVIFSDTSEEEILKKLELIELSAAPLPSKDEIMGTLLIQYTVLDDNLQLKLCTQEQIAFIDAPIEGTCNLYAKTATGKSSALLLKAILTKLQFPTKKIMIIKPTQLAADMLKSKLLETVEHAIVEIDLSSISIVTPIELLNQHLQKLKKEPLHDKVFIDPILMKKKFHAADLILCDDTNLLQEEFINYLEHIQEQKPLVLVNAKERNIDFTFTTKLTKDKRDVHFLQTNPHAKALHTIAKLLKDSPAKDIIVISNSLSKEKLNDDLEFFIEDKALLLDSSKNLIDQEFHSLLLTTYSDVVGLKAKHVILLDLCFSDFEELEFAFELASESVYILYDEECEEIRTLEENYESNKN